MKIVSALLAAVLVNNYVMTKGYGLSSSLLTTKNKKYCSVVVMIAVNILVSAVICYFVNKFIPATVAFVNPLVDILVVAGISALCNKVLNKSEYNYFLLLALNGCIFALVSTTAGLEIVDSLITIVGSTLGFVLSMAVYAGVRTRIDNKNVVNSFKGLPIEFVAACIIALALYAFK